jgi:Protein of unknown function (DUF3829)
MGTRLNAAWLGLGLQVGALWLARPCQAETTKPAGKPATPAKAVDAPSALKKPGPPPDKQTSAKVNAYIELMNAETNKLYSMRADLFQHIDRKVGPTCKEGFELQNPIGPNGGKYDEYRKRLKAKPPLKPDAAALKMVDAVEALWNLGREPGPHSLLQAKTPDEWCKRIKEVFPRYVALFDQYTTGNRELSAYVDSFTEDRDRREIDAALKKYGQHYHYQFARLTLEGKLMMRAAGEEMHKDKPDAAVLREAFAAYLAIADQTLAMMKAEPKSDAEPYPDRFFFFLMESMPKFRTAKDEMLAVFAEKPSKEFGERLDSKWSSLISAYNEIIRYSNGIEWSPKQK